MRENISFAKCTCDFCKKEEKISQSLTLPKNWEKLKFQGMDYDVCSECSGKLELYIDNMTHGRYQ